MRQTRSLSVEQQEIADELWWGGKNDEEIALALELKPSKIMRWRKDNKLPDNQGLFDWQKVLSREETDRIPEKYRKDI